MKKPTKAKLRQRTAERTALAHRLRQELLDGELDLTYLPSGLGYAVHEDGEDAPPRPGQRVEVHYVGLLAERPVVFEESFSSSRGVRFRLGAGEVIAGWDEGIARFGAGTAATLFVPAKLAYGSKGRGQGIPGHSDLIFYVEVVAVG